MALICRQFKTQVLNLNLNWYQESRFKEEQIVSTRLMSEAGISPREFYRELGVKKAAFSDRKVKKICADLAIDKLIPCEIGLFLYEGVQTYIENYY